MLACGIEPEYLMAELTGRGLGHFKARRFDAHVFGRAMAFTAATALSARRFAWQPSGLCP